MIQMKVKGVVLNQKTFSHVFIAVIKINRSVVMEIHSGIWDTFQAIMLQN